jgi:hypothetical protein
MAGFIPAVDCVKVVLHYSWAGQNLINTLWYKNAVAGAFTSAQRGQLIDLLKGHWDTDLKPRIVSGVSLQAIEAINQENASAPSSIVSYPGGDPGTAAGDPFALNTALVGSWRTNQRGRSYRGRFYTPGITVQARNGDGAVTALFAGQVASALATFFGSDVAIVGIQSIVSHFANKLPRVTALVTPITAVIVETLLDSARRRLIGRGS